MQPTHTTPNDNSTSDVLLEVKDLHTHFFTDEGIIKATNGVSFSVKRGQILCVVGESGCGKSVTARSILSIVPKPGRIVSGDILFHYDDDKVINIAKLNPAGREIRNIRGGEISMIFQEPMTSLSPVHTIGNQLMEAILLHLPVDKREARKLAISMLDRVGIPKASKRLESYSYELSGGMRQRAMIAIALVCNPKLLIADEPTTALDVTTQANILDLIRDLQRENNMAVLFITHDLGVVAEIADDVTVMYLGRDVESGDVDSIFHKPAHPYTLALLQSIPRLGHHNKDRLYSVRGTVPHPFNRPTGCDFHPRCEIAHSDLCDHIVPSRTIITASQSARCLQHEVAYAGRFASEHNTRDEIS